MSPGEMAEFYVILHKTGVADISHELEMSIIRGEVYTKSDREQVRARLLNEKRVRISAELRPVAEQLEAIGGEVTWISTLSHALRVRLTSTMIDELRRVPTIAYIDRAYEEAEKTEWYTDGLLGRRALQADQFVLAGDDGENGSGTAYHASLLEWQQLQSAHNGYKEGTAATTRFARLTLCDDANQFCAQQNSMNAAGTHAILTTGTLMGDFSDGQDTAVTTADERTRRSGYSPESKLYFYAVEDNGNYAFTAWEDLASRSPKPHVHSISAGWGGMAGSTTQSIGCNGTTVGERLLDEIVYEAGVLPVVAAGNNGALDGTTPVCRLGDPASALGAFTVGGHGVANDYSLCNQRTHAIATNSSRGGVSWNQGRSRTIVDITAPYYQNWRMGPNNATNAAAGGTSLSAPAVAGMALDLLDNYQPAAGDPGVLDNPGVLHTVMLLQGERAGLNSNNQEVGLNIGYDNRFGSGRAQMRGWTAEMVDSPYYHSYGWSCVDDGEVETVKVNNVVGVHNAVPSDAEYGKAVIWWYDRRFDDTGDLDDVDLRMVDLTNGRSVMVTSNSGTEEKERVYSTSVGGKKIGLEISGYNVTADDEGCGTNSMKVYWAYLFEDNDRDDADGPDYSTATCIGVRPEQ